jgi:hypothetical protein
LYRPNDDHAHCSHKGNLIINPNAPQFILSAVTRIYDDLPTLVGTDWATIQPQVDAHLAALRAKPDAVRESATLFGLLARYEPARLRLDQELTLQKIIATNISPVLADMQFSANDAVLAAVMTGLSWEVDPATVPTTDEQDYASRAITLKDGGVAGGKSIKFQNLDLDLGKMMTVGGGFLLGAETMLDKLTPLAVAGGILVMIGTLLGEMTVKIEQQEATVFWGMIQATGTMRGAGMHAANICEVTNTERAKYGLDALSEAQVRTSLTKLVQMQSIAQTGDAYRIIETFKVKR